MNVKERKKSSKEDQAKKTHEDELLKALGINPKNFTKKDLAILLYNYQQRISDLEKQVSEDESYDKVQDQIVAKQQKEIEQQKIAAKIGKYALFILAASLVIPNIYTLLTEGTTNLLGLSFGTVSGVLGTFPDETGKMIIKIENAFKKLLPAKESVEKSQDVSLMLAEEIKAPDPLGLNKIKDVKQDEPDPLGLKATETIQQKPHTSRVGSKNWLKEIKKNNPEFGNKLAQNLNLLTKRKQLPFIERIDTEEASKSLKKE